MAHMRRRGFTDLSGCGRSLDVDAEPVIQHHDALRGRRGGDRVGEITQPGGGIVAHHEPLELELLLEPELDELDELDESPNALARKLDSDFNVESADSIAAYFACSADFWSASLVVQSAIWEFSEVTSLFSELMSWVTEPVVGSAAAVVTAE
jgi:hypothetical protein